MGLWGRAPFSVHIFSEIIKYMRLNPVTAQQNTLKNHIYNQKMTNYDKISFLFCICSKVQVKSPDQFTHQR